MAKEKTKEIEKDQEKSLRFEPKEVESKTDFVGPKIIVENAGETQVEVEKKLEEDKKKEKPKEEPKPVKIYNLSQIMAYVDCPRKFMLMQKYVPAIAPDWLAFLRKVWSNQEKKKFEGSKEALIAERVWKIIKDEKFKKKTFIVTHTENLTVEQKEWSVSGDVPVFFHISSVSPKESSIFKDRLKAMLLGKRHFVMLWLVKPLVRQKVKETEEEYLERYKNDIKVQVFHENVNGREKMLDVLIQVISDGISREDFPFNPTVCSKSNYEKCEYIDLCWVL